MNSLQAVSAAYARHVFLDTAQEYGRPSSVAAGAYENGSEMTGAGASAVHSSCVVFFHEISP